MDVYLKKEISYPFEGLTFSFAIAHNLFSSFDLDHGTDVLLRSIDIKSPKTILDIGCGYGAIGIVLAKKYPKAQVTMLDRDLLAVRYASANIGKNDLTNAKAQGSVGIAEVESLTFDLIVSNIPAKIGDEAIVEEFLLKPYQLLNETGEYWVVVVNGLNRLIPSAARKHDLTIKEIRKRSGHTVYRIKK